MDGFVVTGMGVWQRDGCDRDACDGKQTFSNTSTCGMMVEKIDEPYFV